VAVAFDPTGSTLATADFDGGVRLWDVASGQHRATLTDNTNPVTAVAFSPDGHHLVTGGDDKTISVWEPWNERLIRTVEGHTDTVRSVSFLSDGRLLASKGRDGTLRFWDCETWTQVGLIALPGKGRWLPGIAFHPSRPILATVGSDNSLDDGVIYLWEIDADRILGQPRAASVTYTSAKIVLVGESGVGKTGLGYRLAHRTFKDHPSTHGQQFWLLDDLAATRADGAECEAVLWDLAGQPDYRLVHALFLDDADLALVLFDPTRTDDPLHGVDYWLRQLGVGRAEPAAQDRQRKVILVAARADRGTPRLTADEIARFCADRGIEHYVVTSALAGDGLPELLRLMRIAVRWDARPTTVTTATFKWIKDTVLGLKEEQRRERVILSPAELRDWLVRNDPTRQFSDDEMTGAVGHLVNHGYVAWLRTSSGELRILLAPELVNNVAASIVLEARRNPKGLGSLEEQRVLAGDYAFPELTALSDADRDVLLDSAVAMFLKYNLCFRETDPLSSRVYLVFPELINLKRPAVKDAQPVEEGVAYTVTGAVRNVYASLVVLLGYTDVFTRTNQWRDQAQYVVGDGLVCGFILEAERDGELNFVLYFGPTVGAPIRMLFQGLFESFLARRDLTVRRFDPVICSKGHQLNRAVVREQLADDQHEVFCTRCGERLPLPRADVPIQLSRAQSADLDAQRRAAAQRSRFEQALFRLKTYVGQDAATQPTCFISYAWGDPAQERWVERELANDLAKAGITVILDRWENSRIGTSVPRFVERIERADRVVVVGTPLYRMKYENDKPMGGFVAAAEGDLIGTRMIGSESRKQTVLPVLLAGTEETALPPLLHGRVYADFRRPERYLLTAFDLILSVHGVPPGDPVGATLRQLVEDAPQR
jgi:GTPase SAR1 family protein